MSETDKVIYVTCENGKTYKLEHILNHHQRLRRIDEERDEMTLRRIWWRRNVKYRDDTNSKAHRADYGDGGKMVEYTVDAIDGKLKPKPPPPWSVVHGNRWYFRCTLAEYNCALVAVNTRFLYPVDIQKFVIAVWRNGHEGREKTMQEFGISERIYQLRLQKFAAILHFKGGC